MLIPRIGFRGHLQEDEGDDEPRSQEDRNSIVKLIGGFGVGSGNAKVGVEEGSVSQPETTVRGES
jgi:hypothetical protein